MTKLRRYRTADGHVPYSDWLMGLNASTAGRVSAYVDRMRSGNFGNSRSLGSGLLELKIDLGPGCRVYYLRDGRTIVVLLSGGDKSSQHADIARAREYAEDYWRRR